MNNKIVHQTSNQILATKQMAPESCKQNLNLPHSVRDYWLCACTK